ncbi:amidase [Bacillus sp. CGMCC 1.16607]|uniref:amidase n=1 Tax=Bacillus sp. CGMCC 1.16607 TaxID=3351842 RepID=UPI00362BB99F
MNKFKILVLSMLISMIVYSISSFPTNSKAQLSVGPLSTWIWNTKSIITNSDQILSFLAENQTKTVFLQINYNIKPASYETFVKKASQHHIEVHALEGAPDWISAKGNTYSNRFFDWLKMYQAQAEPSEKFTGIHLDVEPYLYSGWNSNYKNTVLSYQTLLIKAKDLSSQMGLKIGADIPFWFDEKLYNNKLGKGNLAAWVIKNMDLPTIMAYRDQADGPNGMKAIIQQEVEIAQSIGKRITIAVETAPSSEAEYVSFYEEGQTVMLEQLSKLSNVNNDFAIHYLDSWMSMKP